MNVKQWLPPKKSAPMIVFNQAAWLKPRSFDDYNGGSILVVLSQHKERLAQELVLATDDQLRELGQQLKWMHRYKAKLVYSEAKRRGLIRS